MRMRWMLPMVVAAACAASVFGEPEYVKEVRMDRVEWAPRLPGGKIRMLSVQGVKVHTNHCSRDGLELAQRQHIHGQSNRNFTSKRSEYSSLERV